MKLQHLNLQYILLFSTLGHIRCTFDATKIRQDMATLNVVCMGLDSCRFNRTYDSDSLDSYNCHCGSFCRDLGTCCFDSQFRPRWRQQPRFVAKCLTPYGTDQNIFMVDSCRSGWRDHDDAQELCSSSAADRDDPFLAVPVASLRTGMTYKNYYCALCNENPPDNQVVFWNVEIHGFSDSITKPTDREIHYDPTQNSWTVQDDEGTWTAVTLQMQAPDSVQEAVKECRAGGHISSCSPDWTDAATAEKCSAYTALVNVNGNNGNVQYKNPHCAICNFEEANTVNCQEPYKSFGLGANRRTFFIGMFVLAEEKPEKRCNEGMVYDGLAKKCRRVRCRRNYTLKNGKCVPKNSSAR